MNARTKAEERVSIQIGEALVTMPAHLAAKAYLERLLDESRPIPLAVPASVRRVPPLGADHEGGTYAGLTVHEEDPYELILLPGESEGPWKDCVKWAEEKGGVLPSRFDQLVLFKNMKGEFKDAWYWSSAQLSDDADSAWGQYFGGGYQNCSNVSNRGRARAVRRIPIR